MRPAPNDSPARAPGELTRLVRRAVAGDSTAAEELMSHTYEQVREMARSRMRSERPGHTLTATALVHEAYLRVLGGGDIPIADRAHFFHVAAEAMRRLLVEHARGRGRLKRGGGRDRVPLSVLDLAEEQDQTQIMGLDEGLRRLEEVDAQAAEVVRLRFFAGLSVEDTAETLGTSPRTVKRDWAFARAWLHRRLQEVT